MDAVVDWVLSLMRTIGAPGVGIAIALETVFPPIPSELVLPLAGFTASQGAYSVVAAIVWATVGSTVGAWLMYWLGLAVGADRLRAAFDRVPLMGADDIDRSIAWFERHGRSAIFFGRLIPGVRSFISVPAGLDRMPIWQFTLYTVLGSATWNAALILLGYWLGARYTTVQDYVGRFGTVVAVLVAAAVVVFVVRRLRRRRATTGPGSE